MKKWLVLLLAALSILLTATAEGEFVVDHHGTLTSYTGTDAVVYIPGWVDGIPVRKIGDEAFGENQTMTELHIPAGVVWIGRLRDCKALQTVYLPDTLSVYESYPFGRRAEITVVLPEGMELPEDWNEREQLTCRYEDRIYRDGDFTYILQADGTALLTGFQRAVGDLVIPDTLGGAPVAAIRELAFESCSWLKSITIPDSVTTIGAGAFYGCTNLTEATLPKNLTVIEHHLFTGCRMLKDVVLPSAITQIGDSAFSGCWKLRLSDFPEGLTTIGDSAFHGCNGLQYITLPASLTHVADNAFAECRNIRTVYVPEGSYAQTCAALSGLNVAVDTGAFVWDVFVLQPMEDGSLCIIAYAPSGLTDTGGSLTLPAEVNGTPVTAIGSAAFKNKSIGEFIIPDSIVTVGSNPFFGCPVRSFILSPDNAGLAVIDGALYSKADKRLVMMPVEMAGDTLLVPAGVRHIDRGALLGVGSRCIMLPETLQTIGDMAFADCTALEALEIPAAVTQIGAQAFSGCSALRTLRLPAGVTDVGSALEGLDADWLTLVVEPASPAEEYARENLLRYAYPDADAWLAE